MLSHLRVVGMALNLDGAPITTDDDAFVADGARSASWIKLSHALQ